MGNSVRVNGTFNKFLAAVAVVLVGAAAYGMVDIGLTVTRIETNVGWIMEQVKVNTARLNAGAR